MPRPSKTISAEEPKEVAMPIVKSTSEVEDKQVEVKSEGENVTTSEPEKTKPNYDYRIEIRPIPDRNGIRNFSENLEHFSQAHTVGPLVDSITRKYLTGLDEDDIKYLKSLGCSYNLDDNYVHGVAHEFWEAQYVKTSLISTPMFLYPYRNILDFIKWKYLMKSKFIYVSESEMRDGSKPEATHIIFDESQENETKATRIERKNTLTRKLAELGLQKKKQILTALTNENFERKSENYITVRLAEVMETPKKVDEILDIIENTSDYELLLLSKIVSGISKGVLKRRAGGVFYFDTNLGLDNEAVVKFLLKPENADLLEVIVEKINS